MEQSAQHLEGERILSMEKDLTPFSDPQMNTKCEQLLVWGQGRRLCRRVSYAE